MKNVMVDLETLGTRAGCSILSIGAVKFDETGLGDEFYRVVSTNSCREAGLFEELSTVEWWSKQSEEARKVLAFAESGDALPLSQTLEDFGKFVAGGKVWGNGSDFDNAILFACYASLDLAVPWSPWNNRCYRTLKNLFPAIKLVREGTYHNALDDAKTQARHAAVILEYIQLIGKNQGVEPVTDSGSNVINMAPRIAGYAR